jgi:hypothetical protein
MTVSELVVSAEEVRYSIFVSRACVLNDVQCVNDVKIWTPGGDANVMAMGTFARFIIQSALIRKQLY